MPSTVLTSRLFGDMFGLAEMRELFTDEALVARYLDVEAALARAQGTLGIIPAEAARAIDAAARDIEIDWERLRERTLVVGYPILPLVQQIAEKVPDGAGQYAHWGTTTQDIMDTADALQVRDGLAIIGRELDAVAAALAKLAADHAETPMPGRTHLQHALPVSFGYKAATWLSAIDRHRKRLEELRPRVEVVSFSGAAGTLASLAGEGLATQKALADELGLGIPDITWHTIRDNFTEATGLLALIASSLGKIGYDIMLMMQTETGEVMEPFVAGRGASSTMPQKRNPISSEMMLATAKIVREAHSAMLDAMVVDHERATGQWHVEWQALPTAFITTAGGLKAAREALEGLEVRRDAMRKTLDASGGLIVAEAVMMGLAPQIGRQNAHDLVYGCCRKALIGGITFIEALKAEKEVTGHLNDEEIAHLVDPVNYLGEAPEMVRRLLARRQA
jgi:3-carboxy-cis,cis-muconate cycloisomerase